MTRLDGFVKKGWGSELIFATTDKYCGKLLNFDSGAKCSMHFHSEKDETWHVLSGEFIVNTLDTRNAECSHATIKTGDTWRNPPLQPHQLVCVESGTIVEVSTPDSVEDNYRIGKGDSQCETSSG
jgi:quercetin dioxygenase-like cupin family protein